MDEQNKNLILATALSFLVIMVWTIFFSPAPVPIDEQDNAGITETTDSQNGDLAAAPPADGSSANAAPDLGNGSISTREEALEATPRVSIETPRVTGSLSLKGGRIDDLKFKDYLETLDEGSDLVTLLSPASGPNAYYALYGWTAAGDLGRDVPNANTEWQLEQGNTLTP